MGSPTQAGWDFNPFFYSSSEGTWHNFCTILFIRNKSLLAGLYLRGEEVNMCGHVLKPAPISFTKNKALELPYRKPRINEEGKEGHSLSVGCGREREPVFFLFPIT